MRKILISGYTGLGNFILKTPLIAAIKTHYPDCEIDIIAGNDYGTEYLLGNSPLIRKTHVLKQSSSLIQKVKYFWRLRKEKYDYIFLPFDASGKMLFFGSYMAKIKKRVVHTLLRNKLKTLFYLLSPASEVVAVIPGRHEIDLNLDLFEAVHNKPFERDYNTFVSPRLIDGALEKFEVTDPFIVIQPGAANGAKSAKKWSNDKFEDLIVKTKELYPRLQIVAVGDQGDNENYIKPLRHKVDFINTAGATSIAELVTIVKEAKLVIANDSGVMHIANALDQNLIALYGPTDYTRTRPLGKKSKVLYSKTECFGIMYNFKGNEVELAQRYPGSMDGISVDDVFNEIERILNE